jgi:aconitase A
MRDAMAKLGSDANKINPLVPTSFLLSEIFHQFVLAILSFH